MEWSKIGVIVTVISAILGGCFKIFLEWPQVKARLADSQDTIEKIIEVILKIMLFFFYVFLWSLWIVEFPEEKYGSNSPLGLTILSIIAVVISLPVLAVLFSSLGVNADPDTLFYRMKFKNIFLYWILAPLSFLILIFLIAKRFY